MREVSIMRMEVQGLMESDQLHWRQGVVMRRLSFIRFQRM